MIQKYDYLNFLWRSPIDFLIPIKTKPCTNSSATFVKIGSMFCWGEFFIGVYVDSESVSNHGSSFG
jgi:hypothetical protein